MFNHGGVDDRLKPNSVELQDPLFDNPLEIPTANNHRVASKTRLHGIMYYLRPEILSPKTESTRDIRKTAYLDGLRGVAAFIVYLAHSEAWNHDVDRLQYGFGYRGNYSFITLPLIRVFFTGGHAAVAVFFVISGYVLSQRPLSLMHKHSEEVYPALSSAVFRRAIRLYLPFVVTTVAFFITWHIFGVELEWPKPQPTFLAEVSTWWSEFSHFVNPFRLPSDTWFTYDFPLWTIPVEFQGSMLIFLTLLSFARISVRARLTCTSLLALFLFHIGQWQMFCFLSGSMLSEIDLLSHSSAFSSLGFNHPAQGHRNSIYVALLLVGMYLASQPCLKDISIAQETQGWSVLTSLVPKVYLDTQWWRFWTSLCAPMLVFSIPRVQPVRRALESSFAQYLGRISFALYLIHIPVANTMGDIIFRISGFIRPGTFESAWDSWFTIPKIGPHGLEFDFLLPQAILMPLTFYMAEVFTKTVDEASINLGRRLYEKVIDW